MANKEHRQELLEGNVVPVSQEMPSGIVAEFGDKKKEIPCGLRGEDISTVVFRPAERHTNGYREALRSQQR